MLTCMMEIPTSNCCRFFSNRSISARAAASMPISSAVNWCSS